MGKKIVKIVLLGLMVLGVFIAVVNFVEPHLRSDFQVKVTTYYPEEADCNSVPTNCNDFTDHSK